MGSTHIMRIMQMAALVLAVIASIAVGASGTVARGAGGVTGPAFYVDGQLYRTVATPTDLSGTGAPQHSFDTLYDFGGAQPYNVAEAAPGDPDYNGGRWRVHAIFLIDYAGAVLAYDSNGSGDFDSTEEVEAAIQGGTAIDLGVVKSFVCPVIPLPRR